MKVPGCMVYTEHADTPATQQPNSAVSTKTTYVDIQNPELRSCVKVEVDVLGSRP